MLLTAAMKAVIELLTELDESEPKPLPELIGNIDISYNYAEQMLAVCRRNGVIKSTKGPGGGYTLKIPFRELSLGEVINITEQLRKGDRKPFSTPTANQIDQNLFVELQSRRLIDLLPRSAGAKHDRQE